MSNTFDSTKLNTAQKTIEGCANGYIEYLRENCNLSESTLQKYNSIMNYTVKNFDVPFFRIDSDMLNNAILKAYRERNWSDSHLGIVLNVVSGLFYWARYIVPNPYTLKDIHIKNPITNEEDKRSTFISKLAQKADTTGIVEQYPCNRSKKINSNSITTSNDSYKISYTKDEILIKRDIAIKLLVNNSNIAASEISKLQIFDFLHNRIVVQSQNCRSLMRVILINSETRNAIYDYLKTRKDSDEYLFESGHGEHSIDETEIFDIAKNMILEVYNCDK